MHIGSEFLKLLMWRNRRINGRGKQ